MDFIKEDSLTYIFTQVIRLHYHRSHALLEEIGIYPGQPPLLFALWRKDGQSQKELAEHIHIKPSTVTVMLGRMEKAKLVERRSDPDDQRISRVYLTEHGKDILKEVKEVVEVLESESFANFTTEELVLIRRLFMQMRDNLSKNCKEKSSDNNKNT